VSFEPIYKGNDEISTQKGTILTLLKMKETNQQLNHNKHIFAVEEKKQEKPGRDEMRKIY
jgi:hypothetical protein